MSTSWPTAVQRFFGAFPASRQDPVWPASRIIDTLADTVEAIQDTLGTAVKGAFSTVAARFAAIEANGWVSTARLANGAATVQKGGTGQQTLTSGNILYGRGTSEVGSVSPASLRSALGIRTGVVTFTFSAAAGSSLLTMQGADPVLGGPGGSLLGAALTLAAPSVNDVIIREVSADGTDISYRAERLSGPWSGTVNARYIALVSPGTLT